jgi:anti-anti-sigma factor
MEIQKVQHTDCVELAASGRLDEYWASHLDSALDETIRAGAHHIRLNLSAVTYLSSAGIRILLAHYKQLNEIQGSFKVTEPSPFVRKILDMTRLSPLLLSDKPAAQATAVHAVRPSARIIERESGTFDVLDFVRGATLKCRVIGDPMLLEKSAYREEHARKVAFPETTLGLGLGAFGSDFQDCRNRFGEFLAVAGAAAYLPSDGSNVPDYMLSAGSFVPEVNVLYGLACEGQFASLARFEAAKDTRGIRLSDVVDTCLEISGGDAAAVVMVAEAAGLVGAALRRSPAREQAMAAAAPFTHPEIRNWISFTAEPAYAGSVCLVAGIAARTPNQHLDPLLRTMGKTAQPTGHFHAAAFHYRPIQKGDIDLRTTVKTLFDTQNLLGILHLLSDRREAAGAGETELIRGACWVSPLAGIVREDA